MDNQNVAVGQQGVGIGEAENMAGNMAPVRGGGVACPGVSGWGKPRRCINSTRKNTENAKRAVEYEYPRQPKTTILVFFAFFCGECQIHKKQRMASST